MYVHTHWAYNHPYAARTWTVSDWEGYINGLAGLGYNFLMVWPQLDSMPARPTASDRHFLNTIARAIDIAHERYAMKVAVTVAPNTIGNEQAVRFPFASRPYFVCEHKVNPKDRAEVGTFLAARGEQFAPIANADALAVIDSDPGGYVGSTNDEFVTLMKGQIEAFRSHNPSGELIYWMLAGWESYCRFWEAQQRPDGERLEMWDDWQGNDFDETLQLVDENIEEPWWVFAWLPAHLQALRKLDFADRAMAFPYGVIEGEPSFPLTNCGIPGLAEALSAPDIRDCPRGMMANAQTHCLQLPHSYLFAHFARGGTTADVDLAAFAEDVLPGCGETVAKAWQAVAKDDPERRRAAAEALRAVEPPEHPAGRLSGLLFGDARRFLDDLSMNLEVRAGLDDLKHALDADTNVLQALRSALRALRPYQQRVGFVDAYGGPLYEAFNAQLARLGSTDLDAVLKQFSDWRDPTVRNGLALRLLDAVEVYCREGGK